MKFLFPIFYSCVLFAGCGNNDLASNAPSLTAQIRHQNDSMLSAGKALIQSGDLVLRTGTDFASDEVKMFSKTDKTYSHAGIAVWSKDSLFIYHVEPDFHFVDDKVRKEAFEKFCDPAKNFGYGIARYTISDTERSAFLNFLEDQYHNKIPFDMGFHLATNDSMYCSEMIMKGLDTATSHRIKIKVDRLDDKRKYKLIKQYFKLSEKQFANREIINIDQLFLNPDCSLLQRYVFRVN